MKYGPETKGKLNGKCNRTACPNGPANWYSPVERAHYCPRCAQDINEYTPPHVAKMYKVEEFA